MSDVVQINRLNKRYIFPISRFIRRQQFECDPFFRLNIRENYVSSDLEFFVRLCRDVLLELLMFGERRRITKLEGIGRRFHQISENFFEQIPLLLSIGIDGFFLNISWAGNA